MPKLILVKHSEPAVDLELPPSKWILSDRAKHRAALLADYLALRGIGALHSIDGDRRGADQTVAFIAHGTVISTFVAELLDTDPVPIWESLGLPGLIEIEWPRPSKILMQLNFE